MASYITWKINGQALPKVARVSSSRPPVGVKRSPVEIAGRHGSLRGGLPVFGESTVTISANALGLSQAALEIEVAKLEALLAQPTLVLTREAGGIIASSPAELVTITPGGHTPHMRAEITAVLAVIGPFFSEAEAAHTLPLSGLSTIAALAGSSAPIAGVLRMAGPATSVSVIDVNSGTGISWKGSLAAGAYLYVRAKDQRAWVSASASQWTPAGTDVSSGVDYPAAGRLQIWPKITSLTVPSTVQVSVATAGTSGASGLAVWAGRSFL